jgi:hypothetical protein
MKAMFVAKVMFPTAGNFPMKIFILLLKRAIKSIFGDSLTDIIKIIGLPQKKTGSLTILMCSPKVLPSLDEYI